MDKTENTIFEMTQAEFFDEIASSFDASPPPKIMASLERIVELVSLDDSSRVLDVGTGRGILIPMLIEAGAKASNIVGCDLSSEMIKGARENNQEVAFYLGNICDLTLDEVIAITGDNDFYFDRIIFNACFGNFQNQVLTLETIKRLLTERGEVVISHPLGRKFVKFLHNREPHIVPTLLPDQAGITTLCSESGYQCLSLVDEPDFYFAKLVPA